jgi:hypothetical protein
MGSITQFSKAEPSTSGWELGNKKVAQNQHMLIGALPLPTQEALDCGQTTSHFP